MFTVACKRAYGNKRIVHLVRVRLWIWRHEPQFIFLCLPRVIFQETLLGSQVITVNAIVKKKKIYMYIYIYIYCCPRAFVSLLSETARDGYAWDARFEETLLYVTVLLNYIFTYFRSKCLFEDEYVWRRDRVVWKRIRSILMFILFNSIVKRCFNVLIIRIILHSRLKLLKRLRISSPLPRFKTFYA